MTTSTWIPRSQPMPEAVAPAARRTLATVGALAHWWAEVFTRPQHHHLGDFDLARSGVARELLATTRRSLPRG